MRISARQTLPASAWTRSQSAGSLSPRATFSACGTCTSGTLKTEWMMGNRSDPPCHRECSCYCGIEVPFLGLAQRSLKPRDDVDTALIPCLQRVKSLRWTRRSFFVGRSKIPTLPDRPCLYQIEPINLAGHVYRPIKYLRRSCRSTGYTLREFM